MNDTPQPSATPRTDAKEIWQNISGDLEQLQVVPADFARQLERELQTAQHQAERVAEATKLVELLLPETMEYVELRGEFGGSAGSADSVLTKKLRTIIALLRPPHDSPKKG